jgi:hypothetical protein
VTSSRGNANVPKSRKGKPAEPARRSGDPPHEVRGFHELGQRVLARAAEGNSSVSTAARAIAQEERGSLDRGKAAAFAAHFPANELDRLCAFRSPEGHLLSVNHVRRVLPIKSGKRQLKLLELAAKKGWTADRLARVVPPRAIHDEAETPGPKLKYPKNLLDAFGDVYRWSEQWLKRYQGKWRQEVAWPIKSRYGVSDSKDLAEMIEKTKMTLGSALALFENRTGVHNVAGSIRK